MKFSSPSQSIPSRQMTDDVIDPSELEPQTLAGVAPVAAIGLAPMVATALHPIQPEAGQEARLRSRLFERVARSAAANRLFVTTRAQDGPWLALTSAVEQRYLHGDEEVLTHMLRWQSDATLTLPSDGCAHECLVLQGELHVGGLAGESILHAQDYLLCSSEPLILFAKAGTCLYWRRIKKGEGAFGHAVLSHQTKSDQVAWEPLRKGVAIKPLYAEADRISMLVRFEPGATVPTHEHGFGEECLMVEGDLFLGDVLLCQGDFQFAPKGTGHDELQSDVGCLLYFHGAIDPAVVDPSVRPA